MDVTYVHPGKISEEFRKGEIKKGYCKKEVEKNEARKELQTIQSQKCLGWLNLVSVNSLILLG